LKLWSLNQPEPVGATGATNYKAALELAKETFANSKILKSDIQSVVFISDGIPTAPHGSGMTQEPEDRIAAIDAAKSLKAENIQVNTFPVNINSKLTTMPTISAITGGNYYYHDAHDVINEIQNDSLIGLVGLEIENETTGEKMTQVKVYPDGRFEEKVCLSSSEDNVLKITPFVCESCEKLSYQKISATCEGEKCASCKGQLTMLKLKYIGILKNALVKIIQAGKSDDDSIVIYEDTVESNEDIEFFGGFKDKTMGSNINLYVNDKQNAECETSCGQPKTGPGRIHGDFRVIKGYSRNGGLLCPVDDD